MSTKNERSPLVAAIVGAMLAVCSVSEGTPRSIFERLQPTRRDAGFRMDGYFVWGGSVITVGDNPRCHIQPIAPIQAPDR